MKCFFISNSCLRATKAGVVELVDTPGLGPGASGHAGSNPATRKVLFRNKRPCFKIFYCLLFV